MIELLLDRRSGPHDWLVALGILGLAALVVFDAPTVALVACAGGVCSFPGWLLVRPLIGLGPQRYLLAPPLGVAMVSVLLLLAVPVAGWSAAAIGIAWGVACALAVPAHRLLPDLCVSAASPERAAGSQGLPWAVHLLVLAFVLALFYPFSRVGADTAHGYAYAGLFAHDFLLRSSDVVAVSRQIPPLNYYFAGQTVSNYYPLWYVLPAAVYRVSGAGVQLHDAVIALSVFNAALFCYLLYGLIARFLTDDGRFTGRHGVLVFGAALFLYSYHWLFVILRVIAERLDADWLTSVSQSMSDVSASWLKDSLYEPQAILALMLVIALLQILPGRGGARRGVAVGFLLSVLAVTDIAILFVVGVAWFLDRAIRILRERGRGRELLVETLAAGALGLVLFAAFYAVDLFRMGGPGNALVVRLDPRLLVAIPFLLVLELGPLALATLRPVRVPDWTILAVLGVVGVLFMAFVTESLEGNVILRKALKVVRLPVVLLGGLSLLALPRGWMPGIAAVGLVLALPTWVTDLHASSDVANEARTTYVSPEVMQGLRWLRENTGQDAVVQSAVEYQDGYYEYPPTVFFAERPAAMEYWKAAFLRYPDAEALRSRKQEIDRLFSTTDDRARAQLAQRLGIDFLFVGPVEERTYPGVVERMESADSEFELVYRDGPVRVYRTPMADDANQRGAGA